MQIFDPSEVKCTPSNPRWIHRWISEELFLYKPRPTPEREKELRVLNLQNEFDYIDWMYQYYPGEPLTQVDSKLMKKYNKYKYKYKYKENEPKSIQST